MMVLDMNQDLNQLTYSLVPLGLLKASQMQYANTVRTANPNPMKWITDTKAIAINPRIAAKDNTNKVAVAVARYVIPLSIFRIG